MTMSRSYGAVDSTSARELGKGDAWALGQARMGGSVLEALPRLRLCTR